MSEDLVVGIVTGGGWGVFVGFLLGATWLKALAKELVDDATESDS